MHRRRLLLAASLAPLVALTSARGARADAIAPDTRSADVVSIDLAASVIVLRIGRQERRARFTPLTQVRIGGRLGAVTDLRPGMRVVVRFAASETGRESATLVSVEA